MYEVYTEIKEFIKEQIKNLNYKRLSMKFVILMLTLASILGACSQFNRYFQLEDDNEVEEFIEDVIKIRTGYEYDFTPMSRERGKRQ